MAYKKRGGANYASPRKGVDNMDMNKYTESMAPPHLDNGIYSKAPPIGGAGMFQKDMVLSDYISVWLDLFKKNSVKPSTFERLNISKDLLRKYPLGSCSIAQIDTLDVQYYINQLTCDGYSMSTIKKALELVSASMKKAVKLKLMPENPAEDVELPSKELIKKKKRDVKAYDNQQQARIQRVIASNENNVGYLCVALMIETGLRSGEALALRWSDVSIENVKFNVHATVVNPHDPRRSYVQDSPKSDSSIRTLPLNPKAVAIMKRLRLLSSGEWVFECNGHRMEYPELVWRTKQLCKFADVPYKGEHVFRHTFATNCYYKGVNVKILSKLLGHSDVKVTYNTYIDLYGDGFDDLYAAVSL